MHFSSTATAVLVGLSSLLPLAQAVPLQDETALEAPSKVKRDAPSPTFTNFPAGSTETTRILQAFADAVTVSSAIVNANQVDINQKWFGSGAQNQDVINGFAAIVNGVNLLNKFLVDYNDFENLCGTNKVMAYVADQSTSTPHLHICEFTFGLVDLSDVNCDDIGDNVNAKMSSLSDIVLHEFFHFDAIGQQVAGDHITDQPNVVGPIACRGLASNPSAAINNADNFRWFALEGYYTIKCDKSYGDPTDPSNAPLTPCSTSGQCAIQ